MIDMLSRLEALEKPIRVAVIGTGAAGQGLVYQAGITPGIECVAVADLKLESAVEAAGLSGREHRIVNSGGELEDAVRQGKLAVCRSGELPARAESVDVVLESTNSIRWGGIYAEMALESGKHVHMMNAEADLNFGPYLMQLGRRHGVVYSSCDGDQHGVIRRLMDEVKLWGFQMVMAGNIKGFLDRYADPTSIIPEAEKRFLDPQMCASYTDGSKLCVEMALVANAFDLVTDVPGMHGPRTGDILEFPKLFDLERMFREHPAGVVDYVLGPEPKGGIFVIGWSDSAYQNRMLDYFPSHHGEGPFYLFTRPYHLVHVEAMKGIAEAALDGDALLQPWHGLKTNVYCYAKRDLAEGERLDGFGGYACYGLIENCADNRGRPGMPLCLAEDVTVRRPIRKDEKIYLDDVRTDPQRSDFQMYARAQEAGGLVS